MNNNIVELENIDFSWPNAGSVEQGKAFHLKVDNLSIAKGETVFVHGRSGSGKSTLMGLTSGTLATQQGRIMVAGQNLGSLTQTQLDKHRADNIGIIFQLFNLVPYISVLDNVMLPLAFSKARNSRAGGSNFEAKENALEMLTALGLLGSYISKKKPINLSVGQQQRVAAARALIGNPGLIIADEPTSSLDDENQQAFLDLLFAQVRKNGTSLMLVSHDLSISRKFDRVIKLENGKIISGDAL